MGQNFIECDRDQVLLLPPDLREWLPAGHLAGFVIDTVAQLDLDGVYACYRQDGRGRPAHDPAMMVALVLYAYAIGVTSSRQIERRCVEDVAFRVISANRQPDHSTVARFVIRHQDAISDVFFDVLAMCREAGLVKVGMVAVDSTKLPGNASMGQNRTLDGLEAEARRIIEEAIETDAAEDALYGSARGDELPAEFADPRTRPAKIREALDRARRERAEADAKREEQIAAHEIDPATQKRRATGRPAKPEGGRRQRALFAKKYNVTDPDSGLVRHRGMMMQGYNVQAVASEDQIILAAIPTAISSDGGQLAPTLAAGLASLDRIGVRDRPDRIAADSGYWHAGQVSEIRQTGVTVLVPPHASHRSAESVRMREALADPDTASLYRRRQQIIEPVFARLKYHRRISRLYRRGKTRVQAEITLIATTQNLLKLHTALQAS